MRGLVVLVAACGAEPAPAPLAHPPAPAPVAAVVVTPPVVVVAPPAPDHAIHASHGGLIEALAITDDATVAVSSDSLGATRLWPALDGTHEPVVVVAGQPAKLAIARDGEPFAGARAGERFAVAVVDAAGSLEILSVARSGAVRARVQLGTRPIVDIAATTAAFMAQTDDQAIELFALDGTPRGRLTTDPGEHLVGIAHRGAAALALITREGKLRGRWIGDGGWGARTPVLPLEAAHVVLSADGTRAAGRRHGRIAIVSIATGEVIARILTQDANGEDSGGIPIGFTDAAHLAILDRRALRFWVDGVLHDAIADDAPDLVLAGDGRAIAVANAGLQIVRPESNQYLGYRMTAPQELRALAHGFVISDGETLARLDDQLALRETYTRGGPLFNRIPIDTHRALAIARGSDGHNDLVAIDLESGARTTLVHAADPPYLYQPATRLYATIVDRHVIVGRYRPKTRDFEKPVAIPLANDGRFVPPEIYLPERGALVGMVEAWPLGQVTTTKIAAIDFAAGTVAIAALGTRSNNPELPAPADLTPSPRSPDGRLVAELRDDRITLREAGTARWMVASHGIAELAWTPGGALVGFGNGIARVSLETGALVERQCGWSFGLESSPQPAPSNGRTLCDD